MVKCVRNTTQWLTGITSYNWLLVKIVFSWKYSVRFLIVRVRLIAVTSCEPNGEQLKFINRINTGLHNNCM